MQPNGSLLGVGYSGRIPDGRNNSDKQCVKNVGPIPRGWYAIEPPQSEASKSYFLPLTPKPGTDTWGRDGFQIHGDNTSHSASTGCIVISPRTLREAIWNGGDRVLRVVRNSQDVTPEKLQSAAVTAFEG